MFNQQVNKVPDRKVIELKEDFSGFADDAFGILLFGSYAFGDETQESDVDVCVVKPVDEGIAGKIDVKLGGKYDVKIFEELPLYIQIDIIENHVLIYGNEVDLSEYFYQFRKLWGDMLPRIRENGFSSVEERMFLRRRWMHAKRKILGKAGSF